jgi:hydrogenase maturation factor
VVVGFMMGEAPRHRYVTTEGAKPGDKIIMTKTAGLEGTSIFATDLKGKLDGIKRTTILRAAKMSGLISVVPEALRAVEAGYVHSLHTPTEGGVVNGLWEMAKAASVGLWVDGASIPVAPETVEIAHVLCVDPLKLLSSGALLMSVAPEGTEATLEAIRSIEVRASVIGEVRPKEEGLWMVVGGRRRRVAPVSQDELFRVLESC